MAGVRLDFSRVHQINSSGAPLSGAKLGVHQNITMTNVALFSDRACLTPAANPVVADSTGRFNVVYMATAQLLTLSLKTSADVAVWSNDNWEPPVGSVDGIDAALEDAIVDFAYPLTPMMYDAAGDGVTNDDAEFAALEADQRGAEVDGVGRTYLVSAIPTGARYFNGQWKIGSTFYPMYPKRRAHPLDAEPTIIAEGPDVHYWPGPGAQIEASDLIAGCYVKGYRHEVSVGAPLMGEVSRDGGRTWGHVQTLYSNASYEPRGLVGGRIGASRAFVFFALVDSAGNVITNGNRIIYSDDGWLTFTEVSVTGGEFYPHGEPIVAPNGDIVVYGYGGGNIYQAVTTAASAGAAWTLSTAKAGSGSITQPVEPIVVKIDTAKYLMLVRDGDGTPGDAWATTSTDGKTWGNAWVSSGIPLGSNPPSAIVWGGRLFVYICARLATAIELWQDKLLYADLDATAYYTSILAQDVQSAPPLHVAFAFDAILIGYLNIVPLRDDRWAAYLIDRESSGPASSAPSTSRLIMIGGYEGPKPQITHAPADPPPLMNSSFQRWSISASVSGITTTPTLTADRWLFSASAGTHAATRVSNSAAYRRLLDTNGLYALNVTAASGSGRFLRQRFYGASIMYAMSDYALTLQMTMDGTLPGEYRFYCDFYFGTGGSPSATASSVVVCAQDAMAGGLTYLEETLRTPTVEGKTFGSNNDAYCEIYFYADGSGACDVNFREFGAHWGDMSMSLLPYDPYREDVDLDRFQFVQLIPDNTRVAKAQAISTTRFIADYNFPHSMVKTPSLVSGFGTPADFDVNSPRDGGTAPVAIADCATIRIDDMTPYGGFITGTVASGLTAQDPVVLLAKGATRALRFSVE